MKDGRQVGGEHDVRGGSVGEREGGGREAGI